MRRQHLTTAQEYALTLMETRSPEDAQAYVDRCLSHTQGKEWAFWRRVADAIAEAQGFMPHA